MARDRVRGPRPGHRTRRRGSPRQRPRRHHLSAPAPPSLEVVAGPQALTGEEAAAELAHALDRPMRWRTVDPAEYERMLAPHLGPETAAGISAAYVPPPPAAPTARVPDSATVRTGTTLLRDWAARQDWALPGR